MANSTSATRLFRDAGLLGFIVVLSAVVQVLNPSFLTLENLADMAKNTAILSILSVGMMLVIITRGIDLSIGATLALSGMLAASTVARWGDTPPLVAIALGMAIGLVCGSIVGLLVARGRVLPIIASLGLMNIFRGVTYLVSDGKWISANQMPASFKGIALASFLGVNALVWIALLVNVLAWWFLTWSRMGRQVYAVGSNPESARVSGIDIERTLYWVYALMGALSGLAGVLWVAKFASAQGDTAMGFELSVIAACVLGGVSIAGGSGKISGIVMGTLLLGILNNALPLINVSPFWQTFIQGSIILAAVMINALVKRRAMRKTMRKRRI
ncbi:MAG: ABC transporter permease [Propionivibrio sp.]